MLEFEVIFVFHVIVAEESEMDVTFTSEIMGKSRVVLL